MSDDLERRRRAVVEHLEVAIEQALSDLREIDLADPDVDDYPVGVLSAWAVVYEQRTYDADGDGLTAHEAFTRWDQSKLLTAALGRWLMLDREADLLAARDA